MSPKLPQRMEEQRVNAGFFQVLGSVHHHPPLSSSAQADA